MYVCLFEATVTVVDIDSGVEERVVAVSQGLATGLNLKENQKIYFGGLPTIGNYRYSKPTLSLTFAYLFFIHSQLAKMI